MWDHPQKNLCVLQFAGSTRFLLYAVDLPDERHRKNRGRWLQLLRCRFQKDNCILRQCGCEYQIRFGYAAADGWRTADRRFGGNCNKYWGFFEESENPILISDNFCKVGCRKRQPTFLLQYVKITWRTSVLYAILYFALIAESTTEYLKWNTRQPSKEIAAAPLLLQRLPAGRKKQTLKVSEFQSRYIVSSKI